MIEIKIIDAEHKQDINIPNEPFSLFGRMVPSYTGEIWSYDTVLFEKDKIGEMCFPDENYDFDAMQSNSVFIGAYEGEKCVGLVIIQDAWMKYMYLYDLKVSSECRHGGVGTKLLEKAKEVAASRGYRGIYTIGQDNNLAACKFYVKSGFTIGGFDNHVYTGTSQEGKADIIFYLDF